ncbi:amidohydrolase family protein [Pedobacter cryoconitis]|uniref:Imidazolonepropionase-like amidohydrolase n=1 Tax=Pedobacter cryoconitis TaxID=188932 RepID=A0A327SLZ7_9SPHI|nr:amidohydrolase family protein [Pedobacter cryoconitis]RAJ30306.1 imidazolonepropionase-like amidohydrolase [Pedobacter cryoconitis]
MKKLFILTVSLFLGQLTFAQQTQADLMITGGNIINVKTGQLSSDQVIIIRNDSIITVIDQSKNAHWKVKRIYNAAGKFIIPGLWDMHMHFGGGDSLIQENKNLLPLFLAHGITTVRDASADLSNSVLQWREEIAKGQLQGPTIFTSGPKIEGYKSIWLGDIEVGTKQEIKLALDSLQKLKVDFVKITDNTLKPALFLEAIKMARARGFKVSAHIPSSLTMNQVADAGLSAVEHIGYALKAGTKDEQAISDEIAAGTLKGKAINERIIADFDEVSAFKAYSNMAKHGMSLTPTLSISRTVAYLDQNDHKNDPYLKYIGKGIRKTYNWRVERAAKDGPEAIAFRHQVFEKSAAVLPLLQKAGVKILAGTDAGYLNSFDYPGIGLHQELELLVKYGLTPLQALQASIINSPEFLNQKQYGSISSGKKADILVLDENPLLNIKATQMINAVVVKGQLLDRSHLDQLLESIKAMN